MGKFFAFFAAFLAFAISCLVIVRAMKVTVDLKSNRPVCFQQMAEKEQTNLFFYFSVCEFLFLRFPFRIPNRNIQSGVVYLIHQDKLSSSTTNRNSKLPLLLNNKENMHFVLSQMKICELMLTFLLKNLTKMK